MIRVAAQLVMGIATVLGFLLVVSQGPRPGDFPPAITGMGVLIALFGVVLRIMQAGRGGIHVRGGTAENQSLERYANSRQTVWAIIAVGSAVAIIGLVLGQLFPTL